MISPKTLAIFFIVAFVSVQAETNPNATVSALQWTDAAFNTLLKSVNAASFSTQKLEAIKAGLNNSPFGLAGNQVTQLYDSFISSSDFLSLTQIIQNNIYGMTCQQLAYILNRVGLSSNKLTVLKSLMPYVTDRTTNKQAIIATFGSSDQAQASQIIASSKIECGLFGEPHGNIAFIIDVSNEVWANFTLPDGRNMTRYEVLMSELSRTLRNLSPSDNFTLLPYDFTTYNTQNPLKPATQANIDAAISYMKQWHPQNKQTVTSEALQWAFRMSAVDTAYLVTYNVPNSGSLPDVTNILNYLKSWYANKPMTINTIGLMMGTYYKNDKQATENFLESIANITNGTYKGIIYQ